MRCPYGLGVGIVVSVLALAGCDRPQSDSAVQAEPSRLGEAVRAIAKLDCPVQQGGLKRLGVGADGLSCTYGGAEAEVLLRLVTLNGDDAEAVLAPIETELKALMPSARPSPSPRSDRPHGASEASIHLPGIGEIDAGNAFRAAQLVHLVQHRGGAGAVDVPFLR